jgi:hypothetical protein
MRIVRLVTNKRTRAVAAVDYVVVDLLHDNYTRLEQLILGLLASSSSVQQSELLTKLLTELKHVMVWVKNSYLLHVGTTDCAFHDVPFALTVDAPIKQKPVTCTDCASVSQFFSKLKSAIPPPHHTVVDDAEHKLRLCMAHALRVHVQQKRIEVVTRSVFEEEGNGYIIIDYKMKILPFRFREGTTQYYAKRGLSFHGAAVVIVVNGVKCIYYFDVVVEGDSKQDALASIAVVEVTLKNATQQFPHIKTVTLQVHGHVSLLLMCSNCYSI